MSDVVHATKSALPAPAQVVPAGAPSGPGLTAIVVAVVIVAALYVASEVLIPITLAFLLCFLLSPLVDLLRRIRLGRIPSVIIAVEISVILGIPVGSIGPTRQRCLEHLRRSAALAPHLKGTVT